MDAGTLRTGASDDDHERANMRSFMRKPREHPALRNREDFLTNIVILTGAGISAESGIAPFRSSGTAWDDSRMEEACSAEAFAADRWRVHDFYDVRRAELERAAPNAAHRALARLEEHWARERRGEFTLITQNVDNLHERAGSGNVLHMHGELNAALCENCERRFSWHRDLAVREDCPVCDEPALRPDVVLFGETPYHRRRAEALCARANIFAAIGTSSLVHPAAGLVRYAKANRAITIEVNLQRSDNLDFRRFFEGPASIAVPALVDLLTSRIETAR